jgi:hypothetical protein
MRRVSLVFLCPFLAAGCASVAKSFARYGPDYRYELVEVQRPSKASERYGPQVITPVSDSGKTKYSFEDQLIRVVALPSRTGIEFDLTNKTGFPIRIPWNDAAFVGIDGKSQQVMHLGMKYTDCASQKAPSVIVGHGSITDGVYPCGNLHFSSSWVVDPILPGAPVPSTDTARVRADLEQRVVGKTVQLLLPLQIEDVTNDYMFTFRVISVAMTPRSFMDP